MVLGVCGRDLPLTRVLALLRGLLVGGGTWVARLFHAVRLGDGDGRCAFRGAGCSDGRRMVVIGVAQATSVLAFDGAERGYREIRARAAD